MQTPFELSGNLTWGTLAENEAFLGSLSAASERVELRTVGSTAEGRPITMALVGHPTPNPFGDAVMILAGQHGEERAGPESALQLLRNLAETEDPEVTEYLSEVTWIIVPTLNADRYLQTRPNANGVNLNRDWEDLTQPETQAIARVMAAHSPNLVVDVHEGRNFTVDFTTRSPALPQVHPATVEASAGVEGAVENAIIASGRTHGYYPQSIIPTWLTGSASCFYHAAGLLLESRRQDDDSDPAPAERVADQATALQAIVDYHMENASTFSAAALQSKMIERPTTPPRMPETPAILYKVDGEIYASSSAMVR